MCWPPSDPWRTLGTQSTLAAPCADGPRGLAGVVTHDHDHLTNPATFGWRQATRLMVLRCPQELFRWPMGHLLALLGGQGRSSA
jgi:hypothetical protein